MAQLLEIGKEESARIRVENIIRSDIISELHEILELYCELLLARAGLLESPTCDPGLEEAVKSVMYAAPKTEIKELHQVRTLFAEKFGKEFLLQSIDNSDGKVSEKVVKKLSVAPPKPELVDGYLEEIAKAYGVNWPRRTEQELGDAPEFVDDDADENDENPSGGQAQKELEDPLEADARETEAQEKLSKATPPRSFSQDSPLHVNPPSPSTDNVHPKVTLNSRELKPNQKMIDAGIAKKPPEAKGKASDGVPEIDELAKRFAALKR